MSVLLISNTACPKYVGLFICTSVFFISIINKSFEIHLVDTKLGSEASLFLLASVVTNLTSL